VVISDEIKPIDSSFKKALTLVSELQTTVNRFVNKLNLSIAQIEIFQKHVASKTFNRESTNLGGPGTYNRPLSKIIDVSMHKGVLAIAFFVRNEIGRIMFTILLVFAAAIFLVSLKRNLKSQDLFHENVREQLVLRYPALSAVVIVLNLLQFIFPNPPFVFNAILWIITALSLTIIFRNFIARYWMFAWITMFILFLLAVADNLILQASRPERWIMFGLSTAGILCSSIILIVGRRRQLKEKLIIYFIAFAILTQIVSLFGNFYGRYNLAKTCLTSGFFNIVIAVLFLWTLRFINEILSLFVQAYNIRDKKLFNINFNRTDSKPPPIFYVLLVIGWFVLFARNFYIYQIVTDPINDFITEKRTIGEFSFTIGSVISFFLILYLSALISRVVSFFASDRYSDSPGTRRKGVGSWLLIIRISIITVGLLLAFATLGIPMDRLTIILSALSVGIGFGLQSLVNNLVSGLIISFEKPVNVGDFVEIGGRSGTVKSIGFRSSIVAIGNGSLVVIPNGDFLNQHLVNWTHDNTYKSVDIPISVAYGTNLEKTIEILKELPAKDERVLASPEPTVIIKQFNTSSIDMQLSFWVRNFEQSGAVKSKIIMAIDTAFKEQGIEIPFPQQDLYIRSFIEEKGATNDETKRKDESFLT
jgi:small-conductance mechanosensitive channel